MYTTTGLVILGWLAGQMRGIERGLATAGRIMQFCPCELHANHLRYLRYCRSHLLHQISLAQREFRLDAGE